MSPHIFAFGSAEMVKTKKNITEGPIFVNLFKFALPIMATGILQLLYNMADNIVVGRFSGDSTALAAVGSTGTLNVLIVNILVGLAGGATVCISQAYGAKNDSIVSRAAHTGMVFAFVGGIAFMILGLVVCRPGLELMNTKPDVIDNAELYMRIICIGIPAVSVYNLGAAILRAVGDSRSPLVILSVSGLVNVVLNFVFVLGFKMSVAGVAIATVVSQYASAIWVVGLLTYRGDECYGLSRKKLCFDVKLFARMMSLGIPVAIQNSLFAISNLLVSVARNDFDTITVTAGTIAGNIDGITYTAMNCFFHAVLTFTGQNYGAGKLDRVKKTLIYGLIQVVAVGIVVGYSELLFSEQLIGLYVGADDPNREAVVAVSKRIMTVVLAAYFLCGIMEVCQGFLRGLGYSFGPMVIVLIGACVLRIVWIFVFFPMDSFHTIGWLMMCYPISWIPTNTALGIYCYIAVRRLNKHKKMGEEKLLTKEVV